MASLPITSIPKLCADGGIQLGGITKCFITDMSNLEIGFDPMTVADAYQVHFRYQSGSYDDSSRDSRAGVYDEQKVQFFVPRYRYSVELMRRKLRDRKVGVIVHNSLGQPFALEYADILISYETGRELANSEGYTFEIRAQKTGRGYSSIAQAFTLFGQEGITGGSTDFGQGLVGNPTGSTNPVNDCCVLINQTTIPTAPPLTGNVWNRNRMVTTDAGAKYFIDKLGNSILLNDSIANTAYEKIVGTGVSTYTPTIIDLTEITHPARQLIVERFGAVMQFTPEITPDDPDGMKKWTIEDTDIALDNVWPLEPFEYLQLIKIA